MRLKIVLLNLYHGGHHPQHLECLVRDWAKRSENAELHLVISETSAKKHPELVELTAQAERASVHRVETPAGFTSGRLELVQRERLHRSVAKRYAHLLRADRLMFMILDAAQFSLALDLRFRRPVALSGIYFRPSFHYGQLGVEQSRPERLTARGKQAVIRGALRNPHLRTIFSLDPFVIPRLARWARHTECVFLPEPLWSPPDGRQGSRLGERVERGRRRLVMFGSLDERKGLRVVLDALEDLPETVQRTLALLLAGELNDSVGPDLRARVATFETRSAVQLVWDDTRIAEEEVQPLLRECDLVLATYQRHAGSSGLLVRAAAAGVPVLASSYGLVGAQVREHRLGLTVDATSPAEIGAAIEAWSARPDAFPFDAAYADRFAAANTADAFSEVIFSRLLAPDPRALGDRRVS